MQCACVLLYCHSGLSGFTIQYLTRLSFRKKESIKHKICVFFILTIFLFSEIFLIIRRIVRGIIINVYKFSCKVFVILVRV